MFDGALHTIDPPILFPVHARHCLLCLLVISRLVSVRGGPNPDLTKATLDWRGSTLRPIDVSVPWTWQVTAGNQFIEIGTDSVVSRKLGNAQVLWAAKSDHTASLQWFGAAQGTGYLLAQPGDSSGQPSEGMQVIRRIRLIDGIWLSDLVIPSETGADVVVDVLPSGSDVFVLNATLEREKEWPNDKRMVRYRVTRFLGGSGAAAWSQTFDVVPEVEFGGPYLLAAKKPNQAVADVTPLALMGSKVLVCAGTCQSIICLEQSTGKKAWAIDRIWEFERGFIGPSVWSHYIGRYGVVAFGDGVGPTDAKETADFAARWTCNIVGGPFVVPLAPSEGRQHGFVAYVAVGKARADGGRGAYRTYLQDCIVYEITEEGTVVGMTSVPRMVSGSEGRVQKGGLVWACQNKAFVRFKASDRTESMGSMGGSDMLITVDWYRQLEESAPDAWLMTDKAGDSLSWGEECAFRVLSGGYVNGNAKNVFCLPLSRVSTRDGSREDLLLRVPFESGIPLPTERVENDADGSFTNQDMAPGEDGRIHTWGPYLIEITQLRSDGNILAISIGMEHRSAILSFDLGSGK